MNDNLVVVAQFKAELVAERNRLQERYDFVIAVGSLTENTQE